MLNAKELHFGRESLDKVFAGVQKVNSAVTSTMGLYAHTVVIENEVQKDLAPTVTKDGVSVARKINLPDPLEQLGAKMILEASSQADIKSGDGTTTTVLLGYHALKAAIQLKDSGRMTIHIRQDIEQMRDWILDRLADVCDQYAVDDQMRYNVALVSANGEKRIARIAMEASKNSRGGVVNVYQTRSEDDSMETLAGAIISGRPLTNDILMAGADAAFKEPTVAIVNNILEHSAADILIKSEWTGEMIVFAHNVRDGVEAIIAEHNQANEDKHIVVVPCPGVGTTRAMYISVMRNMFNCEPFENGHKSFTFGKCKAVEISKNVITVIPSEYDEEGELERITRQRDEFPIGTARYRQYDEIIRFILGRRVSIFVGGMTKAEAKERYDRMVDAVHAVDLASQGVIPGGGTVLAKMYTHLPEELSVFGDMLLAPMAKILENGGMDNSIEFVKDMTTTNPDKHYTEFYDLYNGVNIDLMKLDNPVVDPARVLVNALRAAFAVASTIVSTNCYIVEHK